MTTARMALTRVDPSLPPRATNRRLRRPSADACSSSRVPKDDGVEQVDVRAARSTSLDPPKARTILGAPRLPEAARRRAGRPPAPPRGSLVRPMKGLALRPRPVVPGRRPADRRGCQDDTPDLRCQHGSKPGAPPASPSRPHARRPGRTSRVVEHTAALVLRGRRHRIRRSLPRLERPRPASRPVPRDLLRLGSRGRPRRDAGGGGSGRCRCAVSRGRGSRRSR